MPVKFDPDAAHWTVNSTIPITYQVHLADDYFTTGDPGLILGGCPAEGSRVVVIGSNAHRHHWPVIGPFLSRLGVKLTPVVLDVSEATKNPETFERLLDNLVPKGIDRRQEPIIAIGGGVLTDIVGYAASVMLRGTPWVRVVTTGQMWDAGTSCKTGVNGWGKKSRVGTFHAPLSTIIDRLFLSTLDHKHLVDATAEILKVALIMDARLWECCAAFGAALVDRHFQGAPDTLHGAKAIEVIKRAVEGSLVDNADNLYEQNLHRRMHLGHTWGPAWEMQVATLMHGQGVALDMALTAVLSQRRGLISRPELTEILRVIRAVGLPVSHPVMCDQNVMQQATESAKRSRGRALRAPLLNGIGGCLFASDIELPELVEAGRVLTGRYTA
jgi:2-epi-5-epi-valiolone synthase